MRLLGFTHWSSGRDRELLRAFRDRIETEVVDLHDLRSDPDLNRTTVVLSGENDAIKQAVCGLAALALPRIDLGRHAGSHERTGALDSCTLVVPFRDPTLQEIELTYGTAELLAATLAARYELPVFLCDKAARCGEADVLDIRQGGFGTLQSRPLDPDFGPSIAHPQLGVTMVSVRDYFLTFQIDFESPNGGIARSLDQEARELRYAGDPHFLGVETHFSSMASRDRARLTLELTLPDLTSPDPIIQWAMDRAARSGIRAYGAELVGAIRVSDLPGATRLSVRESQILG